MAKTALDRHATVPPSHESGTRLRSPVRRVLAHPHPILSMRSIEVDPTDPAVVDLACVLVSMMRGSPACVGLAAPQIGEPVRVFCMDVTEHKKARSCAGLVVMVNPRVVAVSNSVVMREGCMSVPDWTGNVARAREVTVVGHEPRTGRVVRVDADAMEARCLQHEIDHLDGLVFVDRAIDPSTDLFPRKSYA